MYFTISNRIINWILGLNSESKWPDDAVKSQGRARSDVFVVDLQKRAYLKYFRHAELVETKLTESSTLIPYSDDTSSSSSDDISMTKQTNQEFALKAGDTFRISLRQNANVNGELQLELHMNMDKWAVIRLKNGLSTESSSSSILIRPMLKLRKYTLEEMRMRYSSQQQQQQLSNKSDMSIMLTPYFKG